MKYESYPLEKYEDNLALPVLASKSNLSIKRLISFEEGTDYNFRPEEITMIKPEKLKEVLLKNKEEDVFLAESVIKHFSPEKLYDLLLEVKKSNSIYVKLIIPDSLDEDYSKVFGGTVPIKE